MGTNYYTKLDKCKTCKKEEVIHLGKSSGGHRFLFYTNGFKYYKNVEEMKKWLKDKEIKDGCGEIISHKDFWIMVKKKQKEPIENINNLPVFIKRNILIINDYRFANYEFS